MENNEMVASFKDAIARYAAPTPLAEQDQNMEVYEELEPQWVDVPFKRPMKLLWDWGTLLQSATARVKDSRLAIVGLVMSWACEMSSITVESLFQTLGFEHVWSSHYAMTTLQRNAISEPARTFAHKAIQKDGRVYHIVCATFKGTTTVYGQHRGRQHAFCLHLRLAQLRVRERRRKRLRVPQLPHLYQRRGCCSYGSARLPQDWH